MTPKAEAKELFNKYLLINLSQVNDLVDGIRIALAKKCALIAVNEIILELDYLFEMIGDPCINSSWEYWQNVKQELEKL